MAKHSDSPNQLVAGTSWMVSARLRLPAAPIAYATWGATVYLPVPRFSGSSSSSSWGIRSKPWSIYDFLITLMVSVGNGESCGDITASHRIAGQYCLWCSEQSTGLPSLHAPLQQARTAVDQSSRPSRGSPKNRRRSSQRAAQIWRRSLVCPPWRAMTIFGGTMGYPVHTPSYPVPKHLLVVGPAWLVGTMWTPFCSPAWRMFRFSFVCPGLFPICQM